MRAFVPRPEEQRWFIVSGKVAAGPAVGGEELGLPVHLVATDIQNEEEQEEELEQEEKEEKDKG